MRALIDFNEKRRLITDLILDHQDSDTFYAQLIDELEEEHPGFISRLDEYTALYTLENKNNSFDFKDHFDKQHGLYSSHVKAWSEFEIEKMKIIPKTSKYSPNHLMMLTFI